MESGDGPLGSNPLIVSYSEDEYFLSTSVVRKSLEVELGELFKEEEEISEGFYSSASAKESHLLMSAKELRSEGCFENTTFRVDSLKLVDSTMENLESHSLITGSKVTSPMNKNSLKG